MDSQHCVCLQKFSSPQTGTIPVKQYNLFPTAPAPGNQSSVSRPCAWLFQLHQTSWITHYPSFQHWPSSISLSSAFIHVVRGRGRCWVISVLGRLGPEDDHIQFQLGLHGEFRVSITRPRFKTLRLNTTLRQARDTPSWPLSHPGVLWPLAPLNCWEGCCVPAFTSFQYSPGSGLWAHTFIFYLVFSGTSSLFQFCFGGVLRQGLSTYFTMDHPLFCLPSARIINLPCSLLLV